MNIRSILAVTDLSRRGNAALDRAAQLAVEHRATLKLMCLPSPGNQAPSSAAAALSHAATDLAQRHGIVVRPIAQTANRLTHVAEEASNADLLVIAHAPIRSFAAFVCGQIPERLLRLCHCPVLVTRGVVSRNYARILVAVDFTPESKALVKLGAEIDATAELELFHAIGTLDETKLRSADVSPEIIKAYRHECVLHARDRIFWLTDTFDTRRNRVFSAIGRGDPGRQAAVQQEHVGADLLVVGKRRSSTFTDFVIGSNAQRALRWATSDVLVVPHDFRMSSRAAANQRIAADRGAGKGAFVAARGRAS